jgi:hypothetical protein
MRNKSKKEKETYKSGEVMTMLENMNDGIQLIAETQGDLVKKVDNMENRFDNLENRFDNMENRFDNLESKVDHLQDDVMEIKHKLADKVDLSDFQKLEKRVIKLERAYAK